MLPSSLDIWIMWATRIELNVEFFVSTFCFLCNVYFSVRFAQIPNFDSDLKAVFVILHISKALLAIIHPLAEIFPYHWRNLDNGCYFGAFCYYLLQYLFAICIYLIAIEISLIVIERRMAVMQFCNKRRRYTAQQMLYYSIATIAIWLLVKDLVMFLVFHNERPLNLMLDKVLNIDKFPPVMTTSYITCVASCSYALKEFIRLRRYTAENWYAGRTLAQAIQIKQTGTLTQILLPISTVFFICAIMAGVSYFLSVYLHYVLGYSLYSPMLGALTYAQYVCAAIYNLFSTLYIIWLLKPMRKLMIQDVYRLVGLRRRSGRISAESINWAQEREHHFDYLKNAWK